ncbi:MAG: hypothetical protein H6831_12685 [Planctomycetes bacterium]|nr:hypothetical protein [Planctomycetota bacterium]MCB9905256.1 hypothetical protein [Planctomycetota bacterium]
MQDPLTSLPLLFSFRQLVAGDGFLAGVRMNGRALLEIERVDDREEAWISGVAPVGIAGGGNDRGVAYVEFRKSWTEVLFDLAAEANSIDDFRAKCEVFLGSTEDRMTELWRGAVEVVRSGRYEDPALETGDADRQVRFEVVDLSHLGTGGNEVDSSPVLAA